MPLPIPSANAVASFHDLFLTNFGVDLSPQDSQDLAIHTLQLFYLKNYPHRPPLLADMTKEQILYFKRKQEYEMKSKPGIKLEPGTKQEGVVLD